MKVRNVSSLGDLYVPALDRVVDAGEVVEVGDDAGATLVEQPDNWEVVDDEE